MDFLWTFERYGNIYDAEYKSKSEAQKAADELYAEECEEQSEVGEIWEDDIFLICFSYGEDGEMIIDQREESVVYYENEKSEMAEHGTWHGL